MKIARILDQDNQLVMAVQEGDRLFEVEGEPGAGQMNVSDEPVVPREFLPPVSPRVIYCIGVNYVDHAREGGHALPDHPVVFMKNLAAAVGHQQPVRIPEVCDDEVDYEGELAVIISRPCKNVPPEEALNHVLGFTIANDITARIWQKQKGGTQWCRGKGFDTFCPLGPWLVTPDEIPDPGRLSIKTTLNGEIKQDDTTANMIFDVPTLIGFLSQDTTLLPGTVILTGTPQGIGWARDPRCCLKSGDIVSVEISGLGTLTNPVE